MRSSHEFGRWSEPAPARAREPRGGEKHGYAMVSDIEADGRRASRPGHALRGARAPGGAGPDRRRCRPRAAGGPIASRAPEPRPAGAADARSRRVADTGLTRLRTSGSDGMSPRRKRSPGTTARAARGALPAAPGASATRARCSRCSTTTRRGRAAWLSLLRGRRRRTPAPAGAAGSAAARRRCACACRSARLFALLDCARR